MMRHLTIVLTFLLVVATGCTTHEADDVSATTAPAAGALIALKNARIPIDGVLSGGQPTPEQIDAAAAAGIRTVINLRTEREDGFAWEREAVERAGMRYVVLPIPGADGLTRENVERLDALLDEARSDGDVLLHCGSGNRIGALFALRAAWLEGADPDAALATGTAAGMTRLEPKTRALLGLPPA